MIKVYNVAFAVELKGNTEEEKAANEKELIRCFNNEFINYGIGWSKEGTIHIKEIQGL